MINSRIVNSPRVVQLSMMSIERFPAQNTLEQLNQLKQINSIRLWDSRKYPAKFCTVEDLQREARYAFDSKDYFADLIKQTQSSQDSYQAPIIALSALSIIASSLILPSLDIPTNIKNTLGLLFLFGPLLFVGLNIVNPNLRISIQSASSSKNAIDSSDRISYHEAGHFLAGYLLGIPVLSYDISGEKDAGTEIAADMRKLYKSDGSIDMDTLGALLVISMSGVVAETLRFGRCLGGAEDFTLAYSIMREFKIPVSQREGYLRNSVLSSLELLREYRDSLDEVADAMKMSKSVQECFHAVEVGHKNDRFQGSSGTSPPSFF